jgi:hypothetical protein
MIASGAGLRTGPSKSPARPCGHDLCQGSTIHQLSGLSSLPRTKRGPPSKAKGNIHHHDGWKGASTGIVASYQMKEAAKGLILSDDKQHQGCTDQNKKSRAGKCNAYLFEGLHDALPNHRPRKLEIRGFSASLLGARHIHRIILRGWNFRQPTPTEAALSLVPSPQAIAAVAFVHAECSILGRIQHGSNKPRFIAASVAKRRVRLSRGFLFLHLST